MTDTASAPQKQIAQRLSGRHLGKRVRIGPLTVGKLETLRHEYNEVEVSVRADPNTAGPGRLMTLWLPLDREIELLS